MKKPTAQTAAHHHETMRAPPASSSFSEFAAHLGRLMRDHPVIRAVNFHNTPRNRRDEYRQQFALLAKEFAPVTENDLNAFLLTGRWRKNRPGVIVALYEGYRNGYDVILPLLEEFRLVGWFFVITDFVKTPPGAQLEFAKTHDIGMETREYGGGRYALSWSELRQIDRHHVIASHARSHLGLATLDDAALESEVLGSQRDFHEHLGHPVRSFVSYGGPAYGEHPHVDALIDRANYQFVFSNFRIQRLR